MPDTNPTHRINISLPADWHAAFEAAASQRGVSLSEWLRDAGAERLAKRARRDLSEPRKRGRQCQP